MKKITLAFAGMLLSLSAISQISTFPHFTNFDSEATCGTSCAGACNPAGAWKNADQYAFPQAGTDWLCWNASTPSTATGPDFDHTTGNTTTGRYMYVETSGCNNVTAHLVSAIYDFSAQSAPRISFWWHMYGATMGTMHLDVDTTGLGNWTNDVVPSWTANVNAWQFSDYSVSMLGNRPSTRIRIRMVTGTSFTSDAGVDDINVYQPVANDINLTDVSVGGGCGNSVCTPVIVSFVNAGSDTINTGTLIPVSFLVNMVTVPDTFIAASNILPGDTVTFTLQNGCVDLSGPSTVTVDAWASWSLDPNPGNDSATTVTIGIPIITTYPYIQDFESGQNGWIINNGTVGTWAFGTPAKTTIIGAASGTKAFVTGGLGTGFYNDLDNSYVEGPCFDFSNICDPVIDLNVWWNAEFSWDGMNIETSIDGGVTWQLVGAMGDQTNWYNDNTVAGNPGGFQSAWSGRTSTTNGSGGWVNARHHLTGVGNQPNVKIRISFGTDGSVTDDGVAFDDIKIYNGAYLGADKTICSPSTTTLNADGGSPTSVTYMWSTGATTSTITASTTGWYWVDATNGSCVSRDSLYLVVVDALSDVALGADTTVCSTTYMLDAGYWPGSTYLWSDGSTTQMITANTTGLYSVAVTTSCSVLMDTISLTFNPATVTLGPDVTSCGDVVLDAGPGNVSYLWSNAATTQTQTISFSGAYSVTVTTVSGCTATDMINVIINTPPTISISGNTMVCSGDSTVLTASGASSFAWVNGPATAAYTVTPALDSTYWVVGLDSATGCTDSAMVMVMVMQPSMTNQSASVCYGGTYTVGNNTYNASGNYTDTLVNAMGCDSIVMTALTVDTLIWSSQTMTICSGNTVTVGSNTYSTSGTYSDTLASVNGCDSLVTTNLTVTPAITSSQSLTICNGQSITVGSNIYSASGTYVDTLIAGAGCDSIVTTTLTVITVNVGVTVSGNGDVIAADDPFANSYQWIDCSTMQPIAGETSSFYTATANGSYAVIISDGFCEDTSVCIAVTNIGIDEQSSIGVLNVFPNPTPGQLTITSSIPTEVVIYNTLGEAVRAENVLNTITIDISSLEGGVYFIRTSEGKIVRLVKE